METDNNKNRELAAITLKWQSVLSELMESLGHQGATPLIERTMAEGDNGSVYRDLAHLEQIVEEQRVEFDAFDFISRMFWGNEGTRLWRDEEFQSNLLAWLLNPQGDHGAGDRFLKDFLLRTGAPAELVLADWDEATVVREWAHEVWGIEGRLDILAVDETQGVLYAIENKIFTGEHTCQLTRYRKALENRYGRCHRHHVFLSPNGVLPEQEEERQHWQAADYATVFDLVQRLALSNTSAVREDVRAFLMQYATTLRRNVMPDTSVEQTARKIYLENRALFDLILASKPNYGAELKRRLRDAIENHDDLKISGETFNYLGFVPKAWAKLEAQQTSTDSIFPLLTFGFYITPDNTFVNFGMYPGKDPSIRREVFQAVSKKNRVFNGVGGDFQDGWIRFHSTDYILSDSDYDNWDLPETQTKIMNWVSRFAETQFIKSAESSRTV
ncbi:MAG: PD-(D/E)XK nuclease family protein [Chloroflexota bacterium]|nr:PD-(D/E)XK nuclease family protein [Chloroflexota bacterium]MDE2959646.1 PD-(D/E)XK nuclease family protein [Chloroflexota bacterium]